MNDSINNDLARAISSFCYVAQCLQLKINPKEITSAAPINSVGDPLSAIMKLANGFHVHGKKYTFTSGNFRSIKVPAIVKTKENFYVASAALSSFIQRTPILAILWIHAGLAIKIEISLGLLGFNKMAATKQMPIRKNTGKSAFNMLSV